MIVGQRYWILIFYGFLVIGMAGAVVSVYVGRRSGESNLDEILRALATIILSVGMLLLLYGVATLPARVLLGVALVLFVGAFWAGRPRRRPPGSGPRRAPPR
jgi:hypothetical protein